MQQRCLLGFALRTCFERYIATPSIEVIAQWLMFIVKRQLIELIQKGPNLNTPSA